MAVAAVAVVPQRCYDIRVDDEYRYELLRYAVVGRGYEAGFEELAYVCLSRWTWSNGTVEYCVEYMDGVGGNLREDGHFPDEAAAEACVNQEFDLHAKDWRNDWALCPPPRPYPGGSP